MKRIFTFLSLAIFSGNVANAQSNISDARQMGIGQTVTVHGVVTNGSELGSIRYIQDATGAIPAYGSTLSSVQRGDTITATGALFDFSGLLEISPTSSFTNHGNAVVNPTPLVIPISSASEALEAQLVRIDNVTFVTTGTYGAAGSNTTVQVTDGTNTFDVRINSTTNIDGTSIPTGAVSIVGLMGQFNANYQLIPRDLNDIFAYVAPSQEINVKLNGTTVLNNSTYIVGNTSSTPLVIENAGVGSLSVSGATLAGTNSSEFTTNIVAGSVAALGSNSYTLTYTPTGTGTRVATLSIASNDPDENPYVINLVAVGTDNIATQPTTNPSNLSFPLVEAYTVGGQYAAGTNADNYLVLWKTGSPITAVPVDGTTYKRGDWLGDAKVAYAGTGTSFTPRGVIANQHYYFAVYAFNGPEGFENYLTTSPATGNTTSLGAQIGAYYNGISTNSSSLLSDLSSLINPHTFISYFNYKQTMMNQFEIKDTTAGQSFVTCAYSGENKVFNDPFDWTAQGYSREHSFCHSWMPTYPCDTPELPEYTDQHNLYPTNLQNANTPRSNLALMDVTGTVVFSYLEDKVGYNGSQLVFEPRAKQKGNAARAIFYMATCYNGVSGNNWHIPPTAAYPGILQNEASLKNWHFNDLPDNYEIARNEYVYSVQGNRNPYIDSADFACFVKFTDMTYDAAGCLSGLEEKLEANFVVFPVPSNDKIYVQVNGTEIVSYEIVDMQGRIVETKDELSLPVLILQGSDYKTGSYILKVTTPYGAAQRKVVIE